MAGIYQVQNSINFRSGNLHPADASAAAQERRSGSRAIGYTAGILTGGALGSGAGYLTGKSKGDSFIKNKDLAGKISKMEEEFNKKDAALKNLEGMNAGLEDAYIQSGKAYAEQVIKLVKPKEREITELLISTIINDVEKPNCFLIHGKNKTYCEAGQEWVKGVLCRGKEVFANEMVLNCDDDIVGALKKLKANYKKTKLYNLLHIKDFDLLINPKTSDEETIGAMKSIMGDCSQRYHTTILFTTTNPEELDKIAMEPHRVESVSFDDIDSSKLEPEFSDVQKRYTETKEKYNRYTKERSGLAKSQMELLSDIEGLKKELAADIEKAKRLKKVRGAAGAVIGIAAGLGIAAAVLAGRKEKTIYG